MCHKTTKSAQLKKKNSRTILREWQGTWLQGQTYYVSVLEKGAQLNGLGSQQAGYWLLGDVAVMDTPGTAPCWMSGRYFMMGITSLFSAEIFLSIAEQKC